MIKEERQNKTRKKNVEQKLRLEVEVKEEEDVARGKLKLKRCVN